jgi:hypothetical protein
MGCQTTIAQSTLDLRDQQPVGAWSSFDKGSEAVFEKSNEITAIPASQSTGHDSGANRAMSRG